MCTVTGCIRMQSGIISGGEMEKIMVELEDGSTGSLTFEFVFNTLLGTVATIDFHDENGMPIKSTGKIVSVLYF